MKHHARRRSLTSSLLAALLLGPAAVAAVPSAAALEPTPGGSGSTIAPSESLLEAPQRGRKAIRQLGDRLATAAARNDLSPAELRTLLRTDETAWVDPDGAVYYLDHAPESIPRATPTAAAVAPLTDTFALHSNPGANLTILLDVDGAWVSGSDWNAGGVTPGNHPAWDPARDGADFSAGELQMVQQVWAMVAEDYAPFGVDVTTEDPGDAGMVRSSSTDLVYGTRVLITPSLDAHTRICGGGCGGAAFLDVFDEVGTAGQPAWVFTEGVDDVPRAVAEAASHEAGHNLGLDHDATLTEDYYSGHGVWAPIMGVGYARPVVQWSRGSYLGADNQEDDLAVLTGQLGARPDEAPGSTWAPSPLPAGEAVIATPQDVDAYRLGACVSGSTVQVRPAAVSPNLDVRAALVDAAGTERVVAQPVSRAGDWTTASGMGASLTVPADGGQWTLTVEGVGEGSWAGAGYDDYGSLGAYTVSAPGCGGDDGGRVPGAPGDVVADAASGTATLRWSAPADPGDGPVTGYVVSRSGSTTLLPADARSHTFTGLTASTSYGLTVAAVNAAGAGASVTVTVRTTAQPATVPSAPRGLTVTYVHETSSLRAWWSPPADAGGSPIQGYVVYLDGSPVRRLDAAGRIVNLSRADRYPEGRYVVGVAALNAVGSSPVTEATITVVHPASSSAPPSLPPPGQIPPDTTTPGPTATVPGRMAPPKVVVRGRKAVVTWRPAVAGSHAVTGYLVDLSKGRDRVAKAGARRLVLKGLRPGTHRIRIAARNAVGVAPYSGWAKVRVR